MSVFIVFYIVYTPIHLSLEPHSEQATISGTAGSVLATGFLADPDDDGHGHHERHPAAQHKFKVTQLTRTVVAEMLPVELAERVAPVQSPQMQSFVFSGLSPPYLPRCWQFIFRAALPVRAPSLLS